jgi:hypothetical protein
VKTIFLKEVFFAKKSAGIFKLKNNLEISELKERDNERNRE